MKGEEIKLYAVYGSLRKGLGNHSIIEGSEFVGETVTDPLYSLYDTGFGYPALAPTGNTPVKIEVYRVDDPEIEDRLDALEGYMTRNNPHNLYNKEIINTTYGLAYVYFFNHLDRFEMEEPIAHGDWVVFQKEQQKQLVN